jgi:hypothetical protein
VTYRSRGTGASPTIVADGDWIGSFLARAFDGTAYKNSAAIRAAIDGTPGADSLPSRLVFFTSNAGAASLSERMRIDASGNVGIGTTSPSAKLDVRNGVSLQSTLAKATLNNYDGDVSTLSGITTCETNLAP